MKFNHQFFRFEKKESMQPKEYLDVWSRGNTDAVGINEEVLFTRIFQTVSWCVGLTDYGKFDPRLRSDTLLPRLLHRGIDDAVCDVGYSRARQLKSDGSRVVTTFPDLMGGRLMAYFPEEDLCDGASEVASNGFFDVYNTPPWDTWIAYFEDREGEYLPNRKYLLAYVPKNLIALANSGIDVNPEECIIWLDQVKISLFDRLKNHL